ncbi:MAG: FkbM family methyltransferase [Sulfuritalea sp.]|jgi:FkbM family methyltransferase|nr:FkbM family methyltransferase [Sulfuritalea sp.]
MGYVPILSYITTCKGRLAHLQKSLPLVVGQPGIECIVVDYDCPEGAADWVRSNFPQVRVVKVENVSQFNASHARNLGAKQAAAPWLGFFDADILLDENFSRRILPSLVKGNFYRASPVTYQTWGSIICHRDDFLRAGGYDEVYVGWGGEDDDLIAMLTRSGVRAAGFPADLLDEIEHSDEKRTQFATIKNRWLQLLINRSYQRAKLDLLGTCESLDPGDAVKVFEEFSRTATAMLGNGKGACRITMGLPTITIGSPPLNNRVEVANLRRTITYDLQILGQIPEQGIHATDIPIIESSPTTRTISTTTLNGRSLKLNIPSDQPTGCLANEIFDQQCYAIPPWLADVATVIDIGANVGLAAAYFRTCHPQAAIHCFEPDAELLPLLEENAREITGCVVHPFGLHLADREDGFLAGRDGSATGSPPGSRHSSGDVRSIRLKDAAGAIAALGLVREIDILKVDAGAFGLPILQSLHTWLPKIRLIYIKFHSEASRKAIDALLDATHSLCRARIESPQRGLLTYASLAALPADLSIQSPAAAGCPACALPSDPSPACHAER